MCNGAHIALAILQEIAELPNPHESELFVFTAFVKDLTNLEDFDRYRAHLIGPFVESHECEAWERSFHEQLLIPSTRTLQPAPTAGRRPLRRSLKHRVKIRLSKQLPLVHFTRCKICAAIKLNMNLKSRAKAA